MSTQAFEGRDTTFEVEAPKRARFGETAFGLALFGVLALAAALRLFQLGSRGLWYDELFSDRYAANGLWFLWTSGLGQESNPPLHYTLIWAWTALAGHSAFALRAPSVLFSLFGLIAVRQLAWALFRDKRIALVAAILLALAPDNIFYAQEARPYALQSAALCLALLAMAEFLMARAPRRSLLIYILSALVALYAHMVSILAVGAMSGVTLTFLLVTRRRELVRPFISANVVLALLSTPLILVLKARHRADWIPRLSFEEFRRVATEFLLGPAAFPGREWAALAIAAAMLAAAASLMRTKNRPAQAALVAAPAAFLVAMLVVSLVQPLLMARTLVWMLSPLCVLIAFALVRRAPALIAPTVALALALVVLDRAHVPETREDWPGLLRALPGVGGPCTLVALDPQSLPSAVERYAPRWTRPKTLQVDGRGSDPLTQRTDPTSPIGVSEIRARRDAGWSSWVILRGTFVDRPPPAITALGPPDAEVRSRSDYPLRALLWRPRGRSSACDARSQPP